MRYREKQKGVLSAFAITVGLCFSMQAYAQEANSETASGNNAMAGYAEEDGGTQRINLAGKFRSLSQRIPAVACVLVNSEDPETMAPMLAKSGKRFNRILAALRDGDDELGIHGKEEKRRILVRLDELAALWAPIFEAGQHISAGTDVEESLKYISENNMALLQAAKLLVAEIEAEYANPVDITVSEALLINYSGRQRMLSQKVAKEACGVATGNAALGSVDDLKATVSMFNMTLMALKNGMPEAGLMAAPTDQIKEQLESSIKGWEGISATTSQVTGEGSIDSKAMTDLFWSLDAARKAMNKITGLYADFAKQNT